MFRRGEEGRHERQKDDVRREGAVVWDEDERGEHRSIQPAEVRMREQTSGGPEVTVVGKGARIEGNLISAGSLRIDGQIKGKITAEGDVTLSPQSEVDAEIKATNVTVGGAFKGNITASNKAELAKGGRVDGNVTSKVLVVAEGAIFTGQSIMDGRSPNTPGAAPAPEATRVEQPEEISKPPEGDRARTR
jgi:cytoskeletal protein CcmA (bactofilin family)